MIQLSLDELMEKVDSRYTLVVVAAKRARDITEKSNVKDEVTIGKPVTNALMEIARDKIRYKRTRIGIK
jgi:DNA-directed RNA polymerase subunit omega